MVMVVFSHVHMSRNEASEVNTPENGWMRGVEGKVSQTWGLLAYFQGRLVSFRETIFLKGCILLFLQLHIFFLAVYHGVIQVNRELQIRGHVV